VKPYQCHGLGSILAFEASGNWQLATGNWQLRTG
jgi:hypothetical protein